MGWGLEGGLGVFWSTVLSGNVVCSIDRSHESTRSLSCRRSMLATRWKGNGGLNNRSSNCHTREQATNVDPVEISHMDYDLIQCDEPCE